MIAQIEMPLNDQDQEFSHGRKNILMVSEIKNAGFEYVTHVAYLYDSDEQKQDTTGTGEPKLTITYLLGVCDESDVRFQVSPALKSSVIQKIKNMKIMLIHQVYAGEIFVPECGHGRKHHIFVRGNKI